MPFVDAPLQAGPTWDSAEVDIIEQGQHFEALGISRECVLAQGKNGKTGAMATSMWFCAPKPYLSQSYPENAQIIWQAKPVL